MKKNMIILTEGHITIIIIIIMGRGGKESMYQKEFKNYKPPTFDGEIKKLEDAKSWMLGMKKLL